MPKLKLTKTIVDSARPDKAPYELRDAAIPGFLLKVTPTGRKVFMVAYAANNGQRRKPAIGRFGEITVEQARAIAQDWLADVRKGKDPSAEKRASRLGGVELQVQLLDLLQPPTVRVLAEQVVRTGWHVPVAFALRLPRDTSLNDRNLVISARVVQGHQTLFELEKQLPLIAGDLHRSIILTLTEPKTADR